MPTYVHGVMGQPFLIGTMSQLSSPLPPPHTQIDINLDPLIDALLCSSLVSHFSLFKILPPPPNRPASQLVPRLRLPTRPTSTVPLFSVLRRSPMLLFLSGKRQNREYVTTDSILFIIIIAWHGVGKARGEMLFFFSSFFPFSPPFGINFNKSSFRVSKLDHNR